MNILQALELHKKKTGHTEYEDTEAKLKREEAEEARRVEEYLAKFQAAMKEREEEIRIALEKVKSFSLPSYIYFPCKSTSDHFKRLMK